MQMASPSLVANRAAAGNPSKPKLPTPSAGWTGTTVRLLFGLIWAIDAVLKWLPGYRHDYLSNLKSVAQGQPSWLHGWFHFWISLQSHAPTLFAVLTGVMETCLALVLVLGVARRAGRQPGPSSRQALALVAHPGRAARC